MDEFKEFYPDFRDSVDSTAAASVNGYIGGFGDTDSLSRKTKDFGLSDDGAKHLQNMGGFLDTTLPAALDKGLAVIAMKVLGASHYLSSKAGITPELLIKYALSQDISLAIVGCSAPQEVITLAQVGRTFSPLSPKEQKEIEGFFRPNAPRLAYYRSW